MATHSRVLGKSHGERSLVGCRVHEVAESDTTEHLALSHFQEVIKSVVKKTSIKSSKYFHTHISIILINEPL